MRFFAKEGFDTLVSPCSNLKGLLELGRIASEIPLKGILETTWADLDKGMVTTIGKASMTAWRGGDFQGIRENDFNTDWAPDFTCIFHHYLRQIENDMRLSNYDSAGRIMLQVNRNIYL